MTPVEQAAKVYETEDCPRTFGEDVEAHLLCGYVFSTPTVFAMGRPVRRDVLASTIVNPYVMFPKDDCDAWLVYLVAGDLREALGYLPYPLPWIGWERGNVLRWYRTERLLARRTGLP